MGYSFRLAARVLLYAPFHRQDSTHHSLCYTSHGALDGKRNSSMDPPWKINLTTHRTMSKRSYHGATLLDKLREQWSYWLTALTLPGREKALCALTALTLPGREKALCELTALTLPGREKALCELTALTLPGREKALCALTALTLPGREKALCELTALTLPGREKALCELTALTLPGRKKALCELTALTLPGRKKALCDEVVNLCTLTDSQLSIPSLEKQTWHFKHHRIAHFPFWAQITFKK